jgi:hypothetical protein
LLLPFGLSLGVQGLDLGVHVSSLPCHGLEHGVAAQGVEVCAGVGEGELLRDIAKGDGRVEGEPAGSELD